MPVQDQPKAGGDEGGEHHRGQNPIARGGLAGIAASDHRGAAGAVAHGAKHGSAARIGDPARAVALRAGDGGIS